MPFSPATTASHRPGLLVGVLAFAGIVVSLMQTVVLPLAPMLPNLLGAASSDTAWVVTSTLLASAVATPIMGRLGDMYGKRRMLLISLSSLTAGSVVVALSYSLAPVLIGRVLQGLAAGVIPLGISIMRDILPSHRLGSAIALMSASLGIGGALGLPAAALLVENADWHVLFWATAGLGTAAACLIASLVPESQTRTGGRFDVVGAVGLSAGLSCALLAISKGGDWGWTSPVIGGLFAGAAVILLLWGRFELRVPQPLVDLRATARRQVLLTNIASSVFGFAMFAMSLVLPQLIQQPEATGYGLQQSMVVVGLVMAPSGLVMMSMAPVSARISKAKGPKVTLMVGAVIVASGYSLSLGMMSTTWQLAIVSAIIGAGIGLAYGAMPALVMAAVPVSETAAANSFNTLMRSIGTSMSSAVAGVVLAQMTITYGDEIAPSAGAFRVIMGLGAVAALIALCVAAFLPAPRPAATGPVREPESVSATAR